MIKNWAIMFGDILLLFMPLCSILPLRVLDRDVQHVEILIYGKKLFEQALSRK